MTSHNFCPPPRPRGDVNDAAAYIKSAVSTLNHLRVSGQGPAFYKIGRRVIYDFDDLDQWLAGKRRNSTSDTGSSK